MNILHIDNFKSFDTNMLLGAMIDMGASPFYIENQLGDMGIDAKIYHDTVKRDGMEAEYAYVKINKMPSDVKIPDDIKNFILNPIDMNDKTDEEICTFFAGLFAIDTFAPDFITCKNYDEEKEFERQILKCISNDQSDSYNGDVICVGYGAGDNDILTVVLCKSGNEVIFTQLFEESLL
jgi:uncharacterized protein (DUF111 family)